MQTLATHWVQLRRDEPFMLGAWVSLAALLLAFVAHAVTSFSPVGALLYSLPLAAALHFGIWRDAPKETEAIVRLDCDGLDQLDEFYGAGAAQTARLLLRRTVLAEVHQGLTDFELGDDGLTLILHSTASHEAQALVARIEAAFSEALAQAGLRSSVKLGSDSRATRSRYAYLN